MATMESCNLLWALEWLVRQKQRCIEMWGCSDAWRKAPINCAVDAVVLVQDKRGPFVIVRGWGGGTPIKRTEETRPGGCSALRL